MEKKDKNGLYAESSILLQPSNNILSFTNMSESPLLMPVALDSNDEMEIASTYQTTKSNTMDLSSKSNVTAVESLSQLEQPLLVRKTSLISVPQMPPLSTNSSDLQSAGFPVDTFPPPMCNPTFKGSSAGSFLDESTMVKNNWQEEHSIYPPVISGSSYCDVSRFYTEPRFTETGNTVTSVFSDARMTSVPNSQLNYSTYDPFYLTPLNPHWLFKDTIENKDLWYGFSEVDNECLENAFQKGSQNTVPTDGGRYDVFIDNRIKKSVYFDAKDLEVRRSTWFFQISSSSRYKPFAEEVAEALEKNYYHCYTSKQWQRRFNIPGVGSFSFENPEVMFQFKDDLEVWPALPDSKASPIVVKRGLPDGFEITPSEHTNIDHLVFIVQGIGSFCDLRFRTVSQCVDGFRDIANKLISSHFKREVEAGQVGRIEFLPVAWHSKLHTSDVGLDRRMKNITLPSIPKLRHFTNDTLLDILLYSTPTYCQSIIDTVASELNQMHTLFLKRNSAFKGKVFVAGHSLGSLILFDILANQLNSDTQIVPSDLDSTFNDLQSMLNNLNLEEFSTTFNELKINIETLHQLTEEELISRGIPHDVCKKLLSCIHIKKDDSKVIDFTNDLSESNCKEQDVAQSKLDNSNDVVFPSGKPNNGMCLINYPRLQFSPAGFFALGSPIAMFLSVRGYHRIKEDFSFPTCPALYHIFHPYDPVAFRIEPLIDPAFTASPVLIPHHKGRKRLHLEIRENVAKFASEIKQKVTETMRFTWNSLNEFAKNYSFPSAMITAEVDNILELKMSETEEAETIDTFKDDISIGRLNGGRRIDYVLQEKPIEALNDYVFALTSHATYWDSEDTVLLILREIYAMQGILISAHQSDPKVPADNVTQFHTSVKNVPLQSVSSCGEYTNADNSQILNVNHNINMPMAAITTSAIALDNICSPAVDYPKQMPTSAQAQPGVDYSKPLFPCALPQPVVDYSINAPPPVLESMENIGPPPLSGFVKRSPFMH